MTEVGESTYRQNLGLLLSPRMVNGVERANELGAAWAADNDCFNGLDKAKFVAMLKLIRNVPNCLFVTAPDVVADAKATLLRFELWQPAIRHYGLPVALVAQDGLESMAFNWNDFDALFIGGSTEWKESQHAAALVGEAKAHGKWTHMGRVNSNRRIKLANSFGCDSIDGTGYAKFSKFMLKRSMPTLQTLTMPLPFWETEKVV